MRTRVCARSGGGSRVGPACLTWISGRRLGAAGRHLRGTGTVEAIASHALFLDIVAGERIVSAHEVLLDGVRRWVSLISIAFEPTETGTRVTHTEQYTFLAWTDDGAHDQAHLRGSTWLSFNALAALVE